MEREYIVKYVSEENGVFTKSDPLIRCKDCRFGEEWGQLVGCGLMAGFGITHKPDWFCADAERKDGKGDG